MRLVTPAQWRMQPWKNGGGVTSEIVRWPDVDGAWDVRVSIAEVTRSGPFSWFPGYRRWSILAGVAPIELQTDAGAYSLVSPGDLVEVPGDLAIEAFLHAGPTHLLNVLARPGCAVVGTQTTPHPVRFVFALHATSELPRWHARVLDPPAPVPGASLVWIA